MKTVDKTTTRTTKRNVEPQAPAKPVANTGARRAGPGGNEGGECYTFICSLALILLPHSPQSNIHLPIALDAFANLTLGVAFRDRNAGSASNQRKSTDEAPRSGPRGGRDARGRGGKMTMPTTAMN